MAPPLASPVLNFLALAAMSVWVGGFVAIVVVTRVARGQLDRPEQVDFFRSLGRSYGVVGGSALAVGLICGGLLLSWREWDAGSLLAVLLAATLVGATAAGVLQARGMTRLRHAAVHHPGDSELAARVAGGARRALVLRGTIGAATLALLAVVASLVD